MTVAAVNDRDAFLQGPGVVRDVDPRAAKYLQLIPKVSSFKVTTAGLPSPTSIDIEALPINITGGTVTFSTSAGTLTGTGNIRTLTYANMPVDQVVITASITDLGQTYTRQVTISKMYDGVAGTRGAGAYFATGGAWTTAAADAATPGANVTDDVVTISNGTFTESRRWDGTNWVAISGVFDANMLANASVGVAKFAQGIEPVTTVSAVPAAKSTNSIFNTTDSKLYRWNGTAYVSGVAAGDVSGTLTNAQLAAIDATKVTGKLAAGQLNIDIGGGNLVSNSSFEQAAGDNRPLGFNVYNNAGIPFTFLRPAGRRGGFACGVRANATSDRTFGVTPSNDTFISGYLPNGWQVGKKYVISFYAKKVNGAAWVNMALRWNVPPAVTIDVSNPNLSGVYQRYVFVITWGGTTENSGGYYLDAATGVNTLANDEIHFDDLQIEEGDVVTMYAPKVTELLPGTITATEIADNGITTPKLAAGAVVAGKIAAGAVTADKIAANTIIAKHLVVQNNDAVDPDPLFYDPTNWFQDYAGAWPAGISVYEDVAAPAGRSLLLTANMPTIYSPARLFKIEKGASYRVRAIIFKQAGTTGNFAIAMHIPGVIHHELNIPRTIYNGAWAGNKDINFSALADNQWSVFESAITATQTASASQDQIQHILVGKITAGQIILAFQIVRASSADLIVDGAITANKIAVNSITSSKIAAYEIGAGHIAADQINSGHIIAGAVTASELAADSVIAGKVAANAINAREIAAGAITTTKFVVTSQGNAINPDPHLEDFGNAWVQYGGNIKIAGGSTAPGASGAVYAYVSSGDLDQMLESSRAIVVDPSKTYKLTARLLRSGADSRNMYIYVNFYRADGSHITGQQTGWGGSMSGYVFGDRVPGSDVFTECGGQFGATNPGSQIPSDAKTMIIGVWFNYSGGGASGFQAVQDIRLERVAGSTLIEDGAITTNKVVAGAITASKISVTSLQAITATIGTLRTRTSGARTEISDDIIKVFDGVSAYPRVKIGNLTL